MSEITVGKKFDLIFNLIKAFCISTKTSKTLEISDGLPSGENTQIWILIVSFGNVVDKDKLTTAVWKKKQVMHYQDHWVNVFPGMVKATQIVKESWYLQKLEFCDLGLDMAFLFPDTLDNIKRKIIYMVQILFLCTQNQI